jgi:hypothetical protein
MQNWFSTVLRMISIVRTQFSTVLRMISSVHRHFIGLLNLFCSVLNEFSTLKNAFLLCRKAHSIVPNRLKIQHLEKRRVNCRSPCFRSRSGGHFH